MKRRHFLINATALATAGALPVAALARPGFAERKRFTLAQLDLAHNTFKPTRSCSHSECADERVRISFDGFHAAQPAAVLQQLRVHALFDIAGAPALPYLAWSWSAAGDLGNSQPVSFIANRATMRGFALDHMLADASSAREHIALTSLDVPILHPGQYVLAGPHRDGRAADFRGLLYSGEAGRPFAARNGGAIAFDYLAFRIDAIT